MRSKGRQTGWGLRKLLRSLLWEKSSEEAKVGYVQGQFASCQDAEFEAKMPLTWEWPEAGVSHLILGPNDVGHMYNYSTTGGQEVPRASEALQSQGIHLLLERHHTLLE